MRRLLILLNVVATLLVITLSVDRYIAPAVAKSLYKEDYKRVMFHCDQAMREHFIAKQIVIASTTDATIRNLEAAEIGLTECHYYDELRKKMISWGVTENDLAAIGLDAVEERALDIRTFVENHEIRY